MKNIILSIIDNYNYFNVERFFNSLAKINYQGHVCLFIGPNNDPALISRLKRMNVELIPFGLSFPFIENPHPDNFKVLPDPIHIWNYRHFLYYDYLLKNAQRFSNVLLTDIKDVIFQRDPFSFLMKDALYVAIENQTLAACDWTKGWLLVGYPAEVFEEIKQQRVTCAGTTMGSTAHIMRYLRTMLAEMPHVHDVLKCADQAIQNVLLYHNRLEPTVRLRNEDGIIMTVGTADPSPFRYNPQGYLLGTSGEPVYIIHQADRHTEMLAHLDKFVFKKGVLLTLLKDAYSKAPALAKPVRFLKKLLNV